MKDKFYFVDITEFKLCNTKYRALSINKFKILLQLTSTVM